MTLVSLVVALVDLILLLVVVGVVVVAVVKKIRSDSDQVVHQHQVAKVNKEKTFILQKFHEYSCLFMSCEIFETFCCFLTLTKI